MKWGRKKCKEKKKEEEREERRKGICLKIFNPNLKKRDPAL